MRVRVRDNGGAFAPMVAFVLLAACGAEVGDDACDSCARSDADGGNAEALVWTALITDDWSLAPGDEETSNVQTRELDRDMYVGAIRPIAPLGTHHMALGLEGSQAGIMYAAGVGADAVVFPPGVGLKFPAGDTLTLQVHVYNTSGELLSGTTGVEIVEIAAEDVVQVADLLALGPFGFTLAPGAETTATANCTVQRQQTIFALFPHMHQLGTHFETTLSIGGERTVLYDAPFDFDEQAFRALDPIELSPGDRITTRCTWWNSLDQTVRWGESSDSEMCFSVVYRYPAGPDGFCAN